MVQVAEPLTDDRPTGHRSHATSLTPPVEGLKVPTAATEQHAVCARQYCGASVSKRRDAVRRARVGVMLTADARRVASAALVAVVPCEARSRALAIDLAGRRAVASSSARLRRGSPLRARLAQRALLAP